MKYLMLVLGAIMLPLAVLAQVVDPTLPISDLDAIQQLMALFTTGSLTGLALVAAVVQGLMLLLRAQTIINLIGVVNAKWRLVAVAALSLAGGVLALMQGQGMDLVPALLHSTTLAALQVFAHQIYTHFLEKKA